MARWLLLALALAGPPLAAGELPADLDAIAAKSLAASIFERSQTGNANIIASTSTTSLPLAASAP